MTGWKRLQTPPGLRKSGIPEGVLTPTSVTIGYDAPWRQVHALLLLAAERTPSVLREPVPAVLVRIPDEPHGIRGAHPSHRIAKMEHVLGWMEKYTR